MGREGAQLLGPQRRRQRAGALELGPERRVSMPSDVRGVSTERRVGALPFRATVPWRVWGVDRADKSGRREVTRHLRLVWGWRWRGSCDGVALLSVRCVRCV